MRVLKTDYILQWEEDKLLENKQLISQGIIPIFKEFNDDNPLPADMRPFLMGQCAAAIDSIQPAAEIIDEMMSAAVATLSRSYSLITFSAKL